MPGINSNLHTYTKEQYDYAFMVKEWEFVELYSYLGMSYNDAKYCANKKTCFTEKAQKLIKFHIGTIGRKMLYPDSSEAKFGIPFVQWLKLILRDIRMSIIENMDPIDGVFVQDEMKIWCK